MPDSLGRHGIRNVGRKNLKEIFEILRLGFGTKIVECRQGCVIMVDIVVERDRIQAQIRSKPAFLNAARAPSPLDMIKRRRAKRPGGRFGVFAMPRKPDVRGVICAGSRSHLSLVENPFVKNKLLAGGGGHDNDIHDVLFDDIANFLAIVRQRRMLTVGGWASRGNAESHVRVLRIGNDKLIRVWVRTDSVQLRLES